MHDSTSQHHVFVNLYEKKDFYKYYTFFSLISKHNKDFIYQNFQYIAIVNNNNIDVGVVGINVKDKETEIKIYQAPNVCRLSIISIMESSIVVLQKLNLPPSSVVNYKSISPVYAFKLKYIFNIYEEKEDNLLVNYDIITFIDINKITAKKIIIL